MMAEKIYKGLKWVGIGLVCILVAAGIWRMRVEKHELDMQVQKLEQTIKLHEKLKKEEENKENFTLFNEDEILKYGFMNGIKKESVKKLKVNTPYTKNVYQVFDKEKEIPFEKEVNHKGSFVLENVSENTTRIVIAGYNENGKQVVSQTYEIVMLD